MNLPTADEIISALREAPMYLVTDSQIIGRITNLEISPVDVVGNNPPTATALYLWVRVPFTGIDDQFIMFGDFWLVDPEGQWASPLVDCQQQQARFLNAACEWELCYQVLDQELAENPDEHWHLARIRAFEAQVERVVKETQEQLDAPWPLKHGYERDDFYLGWGYMN